MANIPLTSNGFEATFAFSKKQKAWTTRYSFVPTCYANCTDEMLSFKDANNSVWLHDKNPKRNNFYGESNSSSVELSFNDSPSSVKIFKSMSLETNRDTWSYLFKTNEEYDDHNNQQSLLIAEKLLDEKEGFKYLPMPKSSSNSTSNIVPVPGVGSVSFNETFLSLLTAVGSQQTFEVDAPLNEIDSSFGLAFPFGPNVELLVLHDGLEGFQTLLSYVQQTEPYNIPGVINAVSAAPQAINISSVSNGVMTLSVPVLNISSDGAGSDTVALYAQIILQYLQEASGLFAASPAEINGDEMRGPYLSARLESASEDPLELHSLNVEYEFSKLDKGLTQNS